MAKDHSIVLAVALAVALPFASSAQMTTATISGIVRDDSGGGVPEAQVTATNVLTNFTRSTTADDTGNYLIPNLPIGEYAVTAAKENFQRVTQAGIALAVNQNARVNLTLPVGSITADVSVTGEVTDVDTRSATVGEVVDRVRVQELPINGRNAMAVASVVPEEHRPPFWGHVFYIGLRDHLISPFTTGYQGSALESRYPSNTDMFRKALAQGAAVGYVHASGGDRDPLEGNLGGAKGFAMDAALGTIHGVEWSGSSRGTYTVLHHALNNDLRIAPVGGEDANTSLHRHTLMGSVRTYAYTGDSMTAPRWIDAIREGKTFFSNGPLLELTIDRRLPGESVQLPAEGGTVTLKADAWSFIPLTRVMIYKNGQVWKEIPLAGDRMRASVEEEVHVTTSSWYALSAEGAPAFAPVNPTFPQAGTNAIRVYVGDQKIRSRASAEYFIRWLDRLHGMADQWPGWGSPAEKDRVFAQMNEARRRYEQFAREAP